MHKKMVSSREKEQGYNSLPGSNSLLYTTTTSFQNDKNERLIESKHGILHDTTMNQARKAKKFGIISYWEVTPQRGYWCTHSFYVPNPLIFNVEKAGSKSHNKLKEDCINKNVLFLGRNNEIFFFNSKQELRKHRSSKQQKNSDLFLQIMNP